jgi:2-keto-4-pentenoate hydratase/2-oxohepta-3-ene-1,7-dioic acid hydratase in catechol pathway
MVMKIVVFGPDKAVGALIEDQVVDLSRAYAAMVEDSRASNRERLAIPARLDEFIAAGEAAVESSALAIEFAQRAGSYKGLVHRAKDVKLHAPWPRKRIAMAASNYAAHIAGIQQNVYGKAGGIAAVETAAAEMRKSGQFGFFKVLEEICASGDDILYPKRTKYLDYEGEVAIIIGKRGKDIKADQIDSYVWGITLFNDWTIRDPVAQRALQYNIMKNFDGSATMGPCIVIGGDFRNTDVETRVNGTLRQKFNSRDMVFSFGEILEHLSRDFTFLPGDIISGGTGSGTAVDTTKPLPDGTRPLDKFLKVGDEVEVSSPQIGAIRNRLVQNT